MNPQEIRELRDLLSLSQAQLANMVGVSPAAVAHWEAGRNQPPPACMAIMIGLRNRVEREGANEEMKRVVGRFLIAGGILALLAWIFESESESGPKTSRKTGGKTKRS